MQVDWTSADFVAAFRRGDAGVLEAIYWHYVDVVERMLQSGFVAKDGRSSIPGILDPDRRADLLQEVFLKAFSESARMSFAPELDYRPYVLAIGRNVLIDDHRRRARDRIVVRDTLDPDMLPATDPAEPGWSSPSVTRIVEQYIADLASPLREVHQIRFVMGKTQRETAEELGISRQNLRTFEARLKEGLRGALLAAWQADPAVRSTIEDAIELPIRAGAGRAR